MSESVILIGAGGHAKVLIEALEKSGIKIAGVADADNRRWGGEVLGFRISGGDDWVLEQSAGAIHLVNAVGSIDRESVERRRAIFRKFRGRGYRFARVVHPAAVLSSRAVLGEGSQVMAGAVVQIAARIGDNTIINTRASIDHDCALGSDVHIAPGALLGGGVVVGDATHVGAGAVVTQGVRIGGRCLVAAGAVVVQDVPDGSRVAGVPARPLA